MNNSDSAFIKKENDLPSIKFLEWPIDADDDEQFRAGYPYTPDEEKEINEEIWYDVSSIENALPSIISKNNEFNTNIQGDIQSTSPSSSQKVRIELKPSKVLNYDQRFTELTKEKDDCNNHDQDKYHQIRAGVVTLITGSVASSGLACAKRFAQQGACVIICDLPSSKSNEIVVKWSSIFPSSSNSEVNEPEEKFIETF
ncbi:unnamed protein product [Adineta steineri]|uniref:Uncharacterized protein n=1 Tax=Adineta steineri TaxID=433720 RepID=A0A815BCV8_9BILA|nr:unnamed protein product [Adineta steineri]CAF4011355.1 unnamed protein product [Adineta steineri]